MEAAIAAKPVIKVAALCGSLRKASFNRGLIRSGFLHFTVLFTVYDFFERSFDLCFLVAAIKISKEAINGMEIEYVDVEPLPMLNTDLEVDGTYPPAVEAFRRKILEADSILFASPEYNYSITGTAFSASSSFYFFVFFPLDLRSVWLLRNGWKEEENYYRFFNLKMEIQNALKSVFGKLSIHKQFYKNLNLKKKIKI